MEFDNDPKDKSEREKKQGIPGDSLPQDPEDKREESEEGETYEEEESEPLSPAKVYQIQRPNLLTVLCILTFIGSGLSGFSNLVFWLSMPTMKDMVFNSEIYDQYFALLPELETQMQSMFAVPRYFYLFSTLFYAGSILGAAWMWKMQRKGFHIYTISQCVLILISMLMMPAAGIPWGAILLTGLFVTLYSINLKYMNPINK